MTKKLLAMVSVLRLGPWRAATIRWMLVIKKITVYVWISWDSRHFSIELYWGE